MVGTAAEATSKHLTILASVPDLAFPFFVYMMGQIKDEANRLGDITVVESDGERSSPKQSADLEAAITKGVDGIVINPNDFDALAPALQEAIDSKIPAVTIDRRANVGGIRAHVCANDDMALGALVALKSRNLVGKVALSMRWSRHWPRNTPISISTMFSQLRVDVDHDLPELAAVRSRKGHAVHRRKLLAQVVDPIIVELLLAEAVGGQAELQHRNARGRCTPRRSVARCRPASGRGLNSSRRRFARWRGRD